MSGFKKAVRSKSRGRVAIDGPSGGGKSYSALRLAFRLGTRVAVIDSEAGSASKYAGEAPDGTPFEFDVMELKHFAPTEYEAAIKEAGAARYDVLVIDSLSHAWAGEGGTLDLKDKAGGSFQAWAKVTPMYRRMVDAILASPCHVIATMRSKTEWVVEKDERTGKMVPRKIGTAPVQREGIEYEFDVYGSMDWSNTLTVTKSRCPALAGAQAVKPGAAFWEPFARWLDSGTDAPPAPPPAAAVKEYAAGVAARLEAAAAPNGTHTPAAAGAPPLTNANGVPASRSDKLVALKALRDDLAIGRDKWVDILAKRRVTTAKDLPDDELDSLIRSLQAKRDARALEAQAAVGEADDSKRLNPDIPY